MDAADIPALKNKEESRCFARIAMRGGDGKHDGRKIR